MFDTWTMLRNWVHRGGPWTGSKEVFHGPGPKRCSTGSKEVVHGPGPKGWSMDLGSMFCIRPYGTLFKMNFLLLAPLRYGNIATSTKCIAYLKLAFSSRGIVLFLFM